MSDLKHDDREVNDSICGLLLARPGPESRIVAVLSILSSNFPRAIIGAASDNSAYQFWLMQLVGWGGLCVVTFLSLTLWYNTLQWPYISHVILQSAMGMALTLPLRRTFLLLWNRPPAMRLILSLTAIAFISAVWTMLRIYTFMWMTSEQNIWADSGGWYFASLLVFLCWSALYYGIKYYFEAQIQYQKRKEGDREVDREHVKRLNAEADTRDAQLKMLRYQLNPHFLFNTLNAISALVKFRESDKAYRMIVQLSEFLRYSLDNNPSMMISLQQEVQAVMLYLEIEQTRFGERLTLDFEISEQAKLAKVPSLLLQPLIENSIKHAIAPNQNGGTIKLSAVVNDGELQMELSDTGPGSGNDGSKSPLTKRGRKVGLHNTLQRLKTLYEEAYLFDIKLHPSKGLTIRINIPFDPVQSVLNDFDTDYVDAGQT
jgi:two-component system LytT family sensor kinase